MHMHKHVCAHTTHTCKRRKRDEGSKPRMELRSRGAQVSAHGSRTPPETVVQGNLVISLLRHIRNLHLEIAIMPFSLKSYFSQECAYWDRRTVNT